MLLLSGVPVSRTRCRVLSDLRRWKILLESTRRSSSKRQYWLEKVLISRRTGNGPLFSLCPSSTINNSHLGTDEKTSNDLEVMMS
jgi:hypothetical protein